MGGISIWQLLIIAVIVVLLFGTKKLGSIGSDFTAKTIADKQADTNQEQAKTEDAKRHDKEQV